MSTPAYIGAETIAEEWHVSKATAYSIIRQLNNDLKKQYPAALVISGKVNRKWYDRACLRNINL